MLISTATSRSSFLLETVFIGVLLLPSRTISALCDDFRGDAKPDLRGDATADFLGESTFLFSLSKDFSSTNDTLCVEVMPNALFRISFRSSNP